MAVAIRIVPAFPTGIGSHGTVMIAHHLSVANAAYDAIKAAVASGRLPRSRLDQAVAALQALPNR